MEIAGGNELNFSSMDEFAEGNIVHRFSLEKTGRTEV